MYYITIIITLDKQIDNKQTQKNPRNIIIIISTYIQYTYGNHKLIFEKKKNGISIKLARNNKHTHTRRKNKQSQRICNGFDVSHRQLIQWNDNLNEKNKNKNNGHQKCPHTHTSVPLSLYNTKNLNIQIHTHTNISHERLYFTLGTFMCKYFGFFLLLLFLFFGMVERYNKDDEEKKNAKKMFAFLFSIFPSHYSGECLFEITIYQMLKKNFSFQYLVFF